MISRFSSPSHLLHKTTCNHITPGYTTRCPPAMVMAAKTTLSTKRPPSNHTNLPHMPIFQNHAISKTTPTMTSSQSPQTIHLAQPRAHLKPTPINPPHNASAGCFQTQNEMSNFHIRKNRKMLFLPPHFPSSSFLLHGSGWWGMAAKDLQPATHRPWMESSH